MSDTREPALALLARDLARWGCGVRADQVQVLARSLFGGGAESALATCKCLPGLFAVASRALALPRASAALSTSPAAAATRDASTSTAAARPLSQGDIAEGHLARADLADVCARLLVVEDARGKTFEVVAAHSGESRPLESAIKDLKPDRVASAAARLPA